MEAQRTFFWSSASSEPTTMAPTISQLCFALFIYSLIVLCLCDEFVSASDAFQGSDTRRRPMILPLYLSTPKSSHYDHRRAFNGRRLQRSELPHSPYARMRLYDDLLTNGYLSFYPNFPQIIFLRELFRNSFFMMVELKISSGITQLGCQLGRRHRNLL